MGPKPDSTDVFIRKGRDIRGCSLSLHTCTENMGGPREKMAIYMSRKVASS